MSALSVAVRYSPMPVASRSSVALAPSTEFEKLTRKIGWFVHGAVSRVRGPERVWPFTFTLVGAMGATVSLSSTCRVPMAEERTFWSPARLSSAS